MLQTPDCSIRSVPRELSGPGGKCPSASGISLKGGKFPDPWDFLEIISAAVRVRRKKVMDTKKSQSGKGSLKKRSKLVNTHAFVNYVRVIRHLSILHVLALPRFGETGVCARISG